MSKIGNKKKKQQFVSQTNGEETFNREAEENEEYEVFEYWGAEEESTFPFKPMLVTTLILLFGGAVVITYLFYTDPAAAWDRAVALNTSEKQIESDQSETESAAPSAEKKTERVTHAKEAEPVESVEIEPKDSKPAAVEESASGFDYKQLLEEAKTTRGLKNRIGAFRKVLEINPSGYEALAELAILLMDRKPKRKEAFDLATRSIEINRDNGTAWLALGYIHKLNGNFVEARDAYRKCSESTGPRKYVSECRRM